MIAYSVDYTVNNKSYSTLVDAKDLKSARNKIGHKHGYKTGRMIKISKHTVIGYY